MARPFIPVPGVFKVQLVYTLHGQRIQNVFNVRSGGGLASADADRIEAVFAAWYTNTARLQCSSQMSLVLIVLDALDASAGLHREYTTGWTAPGSVGTAVKSTGVTSAVKLATGLRGRSYRGRIYWPGIHDGAISNASSQINSTFRDAIAAAVNTLRTSLSAGTPSDKLVVVSYMTNGAYRAEGVATDVTQASAHLNLDSMRRRLPGRGL